MSDHGPSHAPSHAPKASSGGGGKEGVEAQGALGLVMATFMMFVSVSVQTILH